MTLPAGKDTGEPSSLVDGGTYKTLISKAPCSRIRLMMCPIIGNRGFKSGGSRGSMRGLAAHPIMKTSEDSAAMARYLAGELEMSSSSDEVKLALPAAAEACAMGEAIAAEDVFHCLVSETPGSAARHGKCEAICNSNSHAKRKGNESVKQKNEEESKMNKQKDGEDFTTSYTIHSQSAPLWIMILFVAGIAVVCR